MEIDMLAPKLSKVRASKRKDILLENDSIEVTAKTISLATPNTASIRVQRIVDDKKVTFRSTIDENTWEDWSQNSVPFSDIVPGSKLRRTSARFSVE